MSIWSRLEVGPFQFPVGTLVVYASQPEAFLSAFMELAAMSCRDMSQNYSLGLVEATLKLILRLS